MAQRRPRDQRVVRNRRVAIYTFLLILTLFYICLLYTSDAADD